MFVTKSTAEAHALHPFVEDNVDGLKERLNLDNIKHCQQDLNTVSILKKKTIEEKKTITTVTKNRVQTGSERLN